MSYLLSPPLQERSYCPIHMLERCFAVQVVMCGLGFLKESLPKRVSKST